MNPGLYHFDLMVIPKGTDVNNQEGRNCSTLVSAWRKESRKHRIFLMLAFCAGAALRVGYLLQPMRYDETYSYLYYGMRPLTDSLRILYTPNNHPLNTVLMKISTSVFGDAPWAIRLPALLAGLLVMPATYLAVRRLYGRNAAFLATALTAPSTLLVIYSTNGRGYSLQVLLFILMVYFAAGALRSNSPGSWAGFTLCGILGFYVIPTMLYFAGSVMAWVILEVAFGDTAMRGAFLKRFALSIALMAAAVFLLYLPIALGSGLSALVSNGFVRPLPFPAFIKGLPVNLRDIWYSWNIGIPLFFQVIMVTGFLASTILHRRVGKTRVGLVPVATGFCLILLFLQRVNPFPRVWMPLLPMYFGASAAGLCELGATAGKALLKMGAGRLRVGMDTYYAAVFAVLLALSAFSVAMGYPYQTLDNGYPDLVTLRDADKLMERLSGELEPGDIIYTDPVTRVALEYQMLRRGVPAGYLYANIQGESGASQAEAKRAILVTDRTGSTLVMVLNNSDLELNSTYLPVDMFVLDYSRALQVNNL